MGIRLLDNEGRTLYKFSPPADQHENIGSAGNLRYRGKSYVFSGVAGGDLTFRPNSEPYILNDNWRVKS